MDSKKDRYDYYEFDLEGSNLYEMSFEELAEWLAKAPRRVQDASKVSRGVMVLLEQRRRLLEARKSKEERRDDRDFACGDHRVRGRMDHELI